MCRSREGLLGSILKSEFSYPTTTTRHRRIPEECGSLLRQRQNTKMFQGKKELGPCRWENHEWRKTAQAVIDSSENFSSCVGREKFLHWCLVRKIEFSPLSLCSAIENYYFLNRFTLNETRGSWVPPAYCGGRGQAQEWYGSITDRRHLSKSPG